MACCSCSPRTGRRASASRRFISPATAHAGESPKNTARSFPRPDTPLIDFILEVERKATGAQLASTAAFSLEASLAAGPVTVAHIAALYPYDNTLRKIWITGRRL